MVIKKKSRAICKRTYGNETKAEPKTHTPTHRTNWGYPKEERQKKAIVKGLENLPAGYGALIVV
ncbi:MAG: hypothetical protein FWC74_10405 [Candidatus Bathyarchaeota archaeon]|nr:hypothetical protein [Candidatus Termitimicrobium sp.]